MLKSLYRSLTSLGFLVLIAIVALLFRPDWRHVSEWHLLSWLQDRQVELTGLGLGKDVIDRINRITAVNPSKLPKDQADLAQWLSKKYRVALEPISAIVAQAFETGQRLKLQPTLILAVMAVESNFNPFAQSSMAAQGRMQVMTQGDGGGYSDKVLLEQQRLDSVLSGHAKQQVALSLHN